ncbi:hypothetical protein JOF53_000128 [Crossiella equi]|uniref:DUF6542 domain-containing protein n=1 Tax=Crossiella equi TaxID=130796 RepID=A0ABS5A3V2_9PSEU|nr:DUF6542 domain-containing protein [Crossiella equi]MBP2471256.1 hypothetical protein [Crossiella equi]
MSTDQRPTRTHRTTRRVHRRRLADARRAHKVAWTGLPWWATVALPLATTALGAWLGGLTLPIGLALGSVAAAALADQRVLFTAASQPPLITTLVVAAPALAGKPLLTVVSDLIGLFPWLAGTTAVVIVVAVVRMNRTRRKAVVRRASLGAVNVRETRVGAGTVSRSGRPQWQRRGEGVNADELESPPRPTAGQSADREIGRVRARAVRPVGPALPGAVERRA